MSNLELLLLRPQAISAYKEIVNPLLHNHYVVQTLFGGSPAHLLFLIFLST